MDFFSSGEYLEDLTREAAFLSFPPGIVQWDTLLCCSRSGCKWGTLSLLRALFTSHVANAALSSQQRHSTMTSTIIHHKEQDSVDHTSLFLRWTQWTRRKTGIAKSDAVPRSCFERLMGESNCSAESSGQNFAIKHDLNPNWLLLCVIYL